ncbi:MAG: helix-turn-helix transcriptional regulator [Actinomycetota bacterium]|nr:helix-turn-helix transcriptional regulator [Actinomycetota bacterium]
MAAEDERRTGRDADGRTQAIYIISVAAELAGVHPQTLRVYERKGLVRPERTQGNTRRYSERDIALLRKIQELTNEGINLAGVTRILELEEEVADLRTRYEHALEEIDRIQHSIKEAIDSQSRMALVPFKDVRRVRRAMKADAIDDAGRRRTFPAPPIGL